MLLVVIIASFRFRLLHRNLRPRPIVAGTRLGHAYTYVNHLVIYKIDFTYMRGTYLALGSPTGLTSVTSPDAGRKFFQLLAFDHVFW